MTTGRPGTTITTVVSLSLKEEIMQHADAAKQTIQDYVRDAVKMRIEQDNKESK